MRRRTLHVCAALVGAGLLALAPQVAGANGASVKVVLSYIPGVSNFGPTTATGTAEILMKEGEVKVAAAGLLPLTTQTYQFWLINTSTGEVASGGRISPDARGAVSVTNVLPAEIPDRKWDMAFLSVEEPDIVSRQPNARRSIAGSVAATATNAERPAVLPNTGGPAEGRTTYVPITAEQTQPAGMALTAGAAGVTGIVGLLLGYVSGRRSLRKGAAR